MTSQLAERTEAATTLRRRDAGEIVRALESWFPGVLDGVSVVRVRNLEAPSGSGFSNETYRFELVSETGGDAGRFVLQAAPLGDALFPAYDLAKMFRLQRGLREYGVPTPSVRWYEDDPAVLGAPFYVMDHVSGQVPADAPSWHAVGFVAEASEADRERLWWSGVETMARLHRVDPGVLGVDLGPVDDPVARRLEFWDDFRHWSCADELPLYEEGRAWLLANRPVPRAPVSVTWGDAKAGNMIFDDFECAAIIDWELCGVGCAEEDLAHWLWMDHYASAGSGVARLSGLPGREETVERYQEWLGRGVEALDWWWVFSALRLSVICHRIMHQMRSLGGLPPETDVGTVNPVTGILRDVLDQVG